MRRFTSLRFVSLFLVLSVVFAPAGCKKDEAGKTESKQADPGSSAGTKAEPAADPASGADVKTEEAQPKAEPVDLAAASLQQGPVPLPKVTPDLVRLGDLFVEMWCAEKEGASKEKLYEIYQKYDYPPVEEWTDVWARALVDGTWARHIVEQARKKCGSGSPFEMPVPEAHDPNKKVDPPPAPVQPQPGQPGVSPSAAPLQGSQPPQPSNAPVGGEAVPPAAGAVQPGSASAPATNQPAAPAAAAPGN